MSTNLTLIFFTEGSLKAYYKEFKKVTEKNMINLTYETKF